MSRAMNAEMAHRFDTVLPEAGGLLHLAEVRQNLSRGLEDPKARSGRTFLHPTEREHLAKVFTLLDDDEEAKSTIMSIVAFAQMKNDVAGF